MSVEIINNTSKLSHIKLCDICINELHAGLWAQSQTRQCEWSAAQARSDAQRAAEQSRIKESFAKQQFNTMYQTYKSSTPLIDSIFGSPCTSYSNTLMKR